MTFARGTVAGEAVRMVAGESNGEGILYAEYYQGTQLRFAVPYDRVFIDGDETTVRELQHLVLEPTLTTAGFAFTAQDAVGPLRCTALTFGDADVTCTRDAGWVAPGDPACAATFASHDERFQCNGLHDYFTTPVIPQAELIQKCSASFRYESNQIDCMRYGYNDDGLFRDTLAACTSTYRDETERKYCMFYSLAPVDKTERPTIAMIRACAGQTPDAAISDCVFEKLTGAKQWHPKSKPTLPSEKLTEPLAVTSAATSTTGADLETATGVREQLTLRATGGMVGTEPVLFIDNTDAVGTLKYVTPIDRITVGGKIRALRELTALDHLAMHDATLTFRVTYAGKPRLCTAVSPNTFASCR